MEREVPAGSAHRSRRLASPLGHRLPPAADLLRRRSGTPTRRTSPNPQLPARFREKKPDLHGLDAKGPGRTTTTRSSARRELNGLLVLQAMLGNSDLKDEQNAIYTPEGAVRRRDALVRRARPGADLRAHRRARRAARRHRRCSSRRRSSRASSNGHVRFDYRGRHGVLFENITPADVRWICQQLQALTDAQWQDAFRAGGYAGRSPTGSSAA